MLNWYNQGFIRKGYFSLLTFLTYRTSPCLMFIIPNTTIGRIVEYRNGPGPSSGLSVHPSVHPCTFRHDGWMDFLHIWQ